MTGLLDLRRELVRGWVLVDPEGIRHALVGAYGNALTNVTLCEHAALQMFWDSPVLTRLVAGPESVTCLQCIAHSPSLGGEP